METISNKYLDKGDIFIPYRDDSYIFIFSTSSLEEGQLKARLISLKIQEELFSLEEEELRRIEIAHSVRVLNTRTMKGGSLSEAIEQMNAEVELESPAMSIEESLATRLPPLVTEISAKNYRSENKFSKQITPLPSLNLMYMPIWDAEQEALASYLCLPSANDPDGNLLQQYRENCANQNLHGKAAYDLSILADVALELSLITENKKSVFIICPVQHDTLHRFDTYAVYKEALLKIPAMQRKHLILMIMNDDENTPLKDKFWFTTALQGLVNKLYIDVSLRNDVNLALISASGFEAVGTTLDLPIESEQNILNFIKAFGARAKVFKIPKAFVLNVCSISITTTSLCSGFDYVGGSAIHANVVHPDTVYKFRHEDLLKGLRAKHS